MEAVEGRNGRYLVIKGGLAWLLWQGGVVNNVVDQGTSSGVCLVVYRREKGEETMNKCKQMHDMSSNGARSALTP